MVGIVIMRAIGLCFLTGGISALWYFYSFSLCCLLCTEICRYFHDWVLLVFPMLSMGNRIGCYPHRLVFQSLTNPQIPTKTSSKKYNLQLQKIGGNTLYCQPCHLGQITDHAKHRESRKKQGRKLSIRASDTCPDNSYASSSQQSGSRHYWTTPGVQVLRRGREGKLSHSATQIYTMHIKHDH